MTNEVDVCIIGAGPAGMAAVSAVHEMGRSVVLLDERSSPGGNIYRGAVDGPFSGTSLLGKDYALGAEDTRIFLEKGIATSWNSSVVRIDGDVTTYSDNGTIKRLRSRKLVLATGAIERPIPFKGWTLPGVMNAGAAQLLLKQSGAVPSGRYVLAGNGPLLLQLATQLIDLGVAPVAILDTNLGTSLVRHGLRNIRVVVENWRTFWKGAGFLATIRRAGVPVYRNVTFLEAKGEERVSAVRFGMSEGTVQELEVDLLLCHEGVIPNIQLSLAIGCDHEWNAEQVSFRPLTDQWGETTRVGTFAVGDCAGILGAAAAPATGHMAALKICADLGAIEAAECSSKAQPFSERIASERRLRAVLDQAYRPKISTLAPITDDIVVCRCEQLQAGEIRSAVADGARGPSQAKAFTRCGMGACQGRICGTSVGRIIAEETGQTREEVGNYRPRFPLKPTTLGELAAAPEEQEDEHAHAG